MDVRIHKNNPSFFIVEKERKNGFYIDEIYEMIYYIVNSTDVLFIRKEVVS